MKPYMIRRDAIVVTKSFLKEANDIHSDAFLVLRELRSLGLPIVERQVKRSSRSVTYAQMEQYINCLDKPEYFLKRFEAIKAEARTSRKKGYSYVLAWFKETFITFDTYKEKYNADHKIISPEIPKPAEITPLKNEQQKAG